MKQKIIIVGGGIIGVAIAERLARYDVAISIIERESELAFGVSKSNSGIIHAGFQSNPNTLKAKLAVRGNKLYGPLARRLRFPFKRVGGLIVAKQNEKSELESLLKTAKKLKLRDVKIKDHQWLKTHEPNLSQDLKWALLAPSVGIINPYETTYALAENAVDNGVKLQREETVLKIQKNKNQWRVTTNKSEYDADVVINAAGLFADAIAHLAQCECETIQPRKGEEFILDKHYHAITTHVIYPVPKKNTKGVLMIPTIDHNYMIGPTAEDVGDKNDTTTSVNGRQQVLAELKQRIPSLPEEAVIAQFSGLRPITKSNDFHIAEDKPRFINCIGIQSPGLTAAPAIAEHVQNLIAARVQLTPKKNWHHMRIPIPRFRELSAQKKNRLIAKNPEYSQIICRCETVTKGEIIEAIRRGAHTLDGIKFRTRCQMGRCHGSFCTMKIIEILHSELKIPYKKITKRGHGSEVITEELLREGKVPGT